MAIINKEVNYTTTNTQHQVFVSSQTSRKFFNQIIIVENLADSTNVLGPILSYLQEKLKELTTVEDLATLQILNISVICKIGSKPNRYIETPEGQIINIAAIQKVSHKVNAFNTTLYIKLEGQVKPVQFELTHEEAAKLRETIKQSLNNN